MKKIRLITAVILLVNFIPTSFLADEITNNNVLYFCENFDCAQTVIPDTMTFTGNGNETSVWSISENNKCARINVNSLDRSTVVKKFPSEMPDGKIIFEADIMVKNQAGCCKRISISDKDYHEVYLMSIPGSGAAVATDGTTICEIDDDVFYRVSFALDLDSCYYDIFVNGNKMATKVPLGSTLSEIFLTTFDVYYISESCACEYYIDNIKMYKGNTPLSDAEFSNKNWVLDIGYDLTVSKQMVECSMKDKLAMYVGGTKAIKFGSTQYFDADDRTISPYICDNNVMVPAKYVTESFGGIFSYVGDTVSINFPGYNLMVNIGSKSSKINGQNNELFSAPKVVNDTVFLSVADLIKISQIRCFSDDTGLLILSLGNSEYNWRDNQSYLTSVIAEMNYERPAGKTIVSNLLNNNHPRLMVDSNYFLNIKNDIQSDNIKKTWYESIVAEADNWLSVPLQDYNDANGIRKTEQANALYNIVMSCGFVYRITGETKYRDRVLAELDNIADFPDYNPYHFLDVGRYMRAMALGFDWMYSDLSSGLKLKVCNAITEKCYPELLKDYYNLPRDRSYKWTLSGMGDNWNTEINSGAIMSALAICDESGCRDICEEVLGESIPSLEKAFNMLVPDGSWYEGVAYWTATARDMIQSIDVLEKATGSDYGFFNAPGFKESPYFISYMSSTEGIFNFNFAGEAKYALSSMFYMSERLNDNNLKKILLSGLADQSSIKPDGNCLALIYCKGDADIDTDVIELGLDKYVRGTEVVTMRDTWDKENMFFAGIHAGKNNVPNGQLDAGTFVIDAYGSRFVSDLGIENYDLTGYYEKYRNRAEGNNCYIINPSLNCRDQVIDAYPYFNRFESNDISCYAVTDLTKAYSDKVISATRGMKMTNHRTSLVLQDEVHCIEPSEIYWGVHTKSEISISEDGRTAILDINGNKMEAKILSDDGTFSLMEAQPLPETFQLDGQNDNNGFKKLSVHFVNKKDVALTVCFTPIGYSDDVNINYPLVKPISEWSLDAAETEKTTIPINSIKLTKNDEVISALVSSTKNTTGILVLSSYNGERLVNVNIKTIDIIRGWNAPSVNLSSKGANKVCGMLFDNINNISPQCSSQEIVCE